MCLALVSFIATNRDGSKLLQTTMGGPLNSIKHTNEGRFHPRSLLVRQKQYLLQHTKPQSRAANLLGDEIVHGLFGAKSFPRVSTPQLAAEEEAAEGEAADSEENEFAPGQEVANVNMTWRPHRLQDEGVNVDTWFSPDFIHNMDMEGKPHIASYLNVQLISDDDSQNGTASNSTGNSTAESSEGDDVEEDGVLLPTGGMAFEEDYVGRPPKAHYKRRVLPGVNVDGSVFCGQAQTGEAMDCGFSEWNAR